MVYLKEVRRRKYWHCCMLNTGQRQTVNLKQRLAHVSWHSTVRKLLKRLSWRFR